MLAQRLRYSRRIKDEDISVVVNVVHGEIVDPSEDLIYNELDSLQGTICEEDIINELFGLPEDDIIRTEETPYDSRMVMCVFIYIAANPPCGERAFFKKKRVFLLGAKMQQHGGILLCAAGSLV